MTGEVYFIIDLFTFQHRAKVVKSRCQNASKPIKQLSIIRTENSFPFFSIVQQPLVGHGLFTVEALRLYSDTPRSVGLPQDE